MKHISYAVAGTALLAGGGWLALQYALYRNAPAVLDTIDRISGGARGVTLVEQAQFGGDSAQKLRVYRADNVDGPQPVILFIHGGSWRSGDPDDYGFVARALAPEGFVVVLAGYRLGEGGQFPAMLQDAASAAAWTAQNISQFGGDSERMFVGGHSAGAYNVAMIALDPQWLHAAGSRPEAIAGVIGLAGPYDFYPFDSDSTKAAFGDAPDPRATQPVEFATADAPPMLLLTGEADTTVKPRNTRALAAKVAEAGGRVDTEIYSGLDHSGILTALASPWRRNRTVIDRIIAFAKNPPPSSDAVQPPPR